MAPITNNVNISSPPSPISGAHLVPISAPQKTLNDTLLENYTRSRKFAADLYHTLPIGGLRFFGRVENYIGEEVRDISALGSRAYAELRETFTSVSESISHAIQQIETSFLDVVGLKEADVRLSQMTPLGSAFVAPRYLKPGNSSANKSILHLISSRTTSEYSSRLESSSLSALSQVMQSMRASLAYISHSLGELEQNLSTRLTETVSSDYTNSSQTETLKPWSSTFGTNISSLAFKSTEAPTRLALSLETYLQAQYAPFPSRIEISNSETFTLSENHTFLSSIPEENLFLHSLAERTNTALIALREAIRGERFFVYRNSENQNSSARTEAVTNSSSTNRDSKQNPILEVSVHSNSVLARSENNLHNTGVVPSQLDLATTTPSVITQAIAIQLATQQTRTQQAGSPLSFQTMLNGFEREHSQVEASGASTHSGSHSEDHSSEGGQDSQFFSSQSELAFEETEPQISPATRLPAGDFQASVFTLT